VSVPGGASIVIVVSGAFKYWGVPPLTLTLTLRAVAGTYFGWMDDGLTEFQTIVKVTFAIWLGDIPGALGTLEPPAPPPPHALSIPAITKTAGMRAMRRSEAKFLNEVNFIEISRERSE
jgi:hypothetical protein